MKIVSNQNPKFKMLMKLKLKKHRIESGLFIVEGRRIIEHGIKLGISPDIIVYSSEVNERLRDDERDAVFEKALFDRISVTVNSQGIIAVFSVSDIKKKLVTVSRNIIVLNGVSEPGNIGTIIRTAEAFGFDRIYITKNSTDPYSDKALRASMGGIFKVEIRHGFRADDLISLLKRDGYELITSSLKAGLSLSELAVKKSGEKPFALVFGNEANGVEREFEDSSDYTYKIEMAGSSESLNVAQAAAISMYVLRDK